MNFYFISMNNIINYYWIIAPIFLFFSGEVSMISFGILSVRYPHIVNIYILLINCIIMSFVSEQFFFFLPRFSEKKLKQYKNHWLFQKVVNQDHKKGLILFAFSRFFPVFRIITPLALGTTNISVSLFSIINFLVSCLWCIGFLSLGTFIGKRTLNFQLEVILNLIGQKYNFYKNIFMKFILIPIVIGIISYFIYRYLKKIK